ncbi:MAG: hypothetical protein ACYTKD_22665 [Planctomycetota bacterium]
MSTLKEYLKTKRERMDDLATKREDIKRRWVEVLTRLMLQIDEWGKPLEEVGLSTEDQSMQVNEHALGAYEAPARRLVFGMTTVRVSPVARIIIGGDGRVDILGPAERMMLIYDEAEDAWAVVSPADRSNRRPFDKDRFEEILKAYL